MWPSSRMVIFCACWRRDGWNSSPPPDDAFALGTGSVSTLGYERRTRHHPLESFAFGMTRPTRKGLHLAATFITLITSCSDSTGAITRVRL